MTRARTDIEQVERANTAFYEALERGDFDAVTDLWLDPADLADGTGSGGPSSLTTALSRLPVDLEDDEDSGTAGATGATGAPADDSDDGADDFGDDGFGDETEGAAAISCVHPGWPVLTGRGEVLRSYALIMANTEYIQFFLTDVRVSVAADTALVTCTENILSGGPAPRDGDELGPLVGQLVVATNVFRRTCDGWKLWSHHASPVLAESGDDEDDETPS
ncbi:nuclear transport factor 2 family protein [Streptomyces spectabilis]|uniref:nuclear transport factor 2 family protein n=1 Tax=Streptomyces spectabilis TaxID=68270 RepID=UPI001CEF5DBB|nr:nuclear transport factor 2 family protein [Streptomyces spectabilis]